MQCSYFFWQFKPRRSYKLGSYKKKECTRIPNFCNSWGWNNALGWNNAFKLTRAKIIVVCQNHSCLYLSVSSKHSWSWSWLFTIVTCSHLSPVHIITVTESHYNVYHKHVTDNCKWGRKPWFYMHKNCWHNSWNGVLGEVNVFTIQNCGWDWGERCNCVSLSLSFIQ